nr:tetratricopeptide repeat protein [Flavobacterium sp. JXAS1]
MNVTDYTYLINKPDAITEKQTEGLGNVLNEFPYFQSARALRLKGLYNQNSFKYNYALKVTAAHTTDRSVLFDFITSETFVSIQNDYYDQKLLDLLDITVFESEIVLPEIQKVPEIRIDPIEQSILTSIKQATTVVFEESIKTEEKPVAPVIIPIKIEPEVVFEEVIKAKEQPADIVTEQQPVVLPAKEETEVVFEELIKTEEPVTGTPIEQASSTYIKEETEVVSKEPTKAEEQTVAPITEQPIIVPIKEEAITAFEKPIQTVEQPALTSTQEETPIVAEKTVTTPDVHIDPIEESTFTSLKEATSVAFEEAAITTEPKETDTQDNLKIAEENLEIGKPLDFSVSEKHSFQEWLQLSRTEPIDRTNEGPQENTVAVNEVEKTPEPVIEAIAPIELTNEAPQENTEAVIEVEKTPEPVMEAVAPIDETEAIEDEKKKKAELIDKFIETNPKITPVKSVAATTTTQFDINKEENPYLMTETLARVYLEQKKYTKAIQAYEILILKYPEKISFFADRISDIKILQQNNNNN